MSFDGEIFDGFECINPLGWHFLCLEKLFPNPEDKDFLHYKNLKFFLSQLNI